jgi:SARP family transcriptional regulator, regulator of embCAB operon
LEPNAVCIQICGSIVLEIDGQRLEHLLPSRQGRALFAFLVVHHDQPLPRPEIIDALWPTGGPEAADAALSVLLSRLRRPLGADRLDGRGVVRLTLGGASIDLDTARDAIHRAESAVIQQQWERAWASAQAALFTARRGFLPGEDALWIDGVRRELEELHIRALEAYGVAGLGLGGTEMSAGREAGRTLVDLAPLRESGHRLLMRSLAAEGNPAEALRAYDALQRLLRDELGVSPSAETQALYSDLLG